MIELPETYVLAEQINNTLIGKTIVKFAANTHPHAFAWYSGDPKEYHKIPRARRKTSQITSTFN